MIRFVAITHFNNKNGIKKNKMNYHCIRHSLDEKMMLQMVPLFLHFRSRWWSNDESWYSYLVPQYRPIHTYIWYTQHCSYWVHIIYSLCSRDGGIGNDAHDTRNENEFNIHDNVKQLVIYSVKQPNWMICLFLAIRWKQH